MLTLTRAVGEKILIGDDIVIEVRAVVDSTHVRIAVEAPRQIPVHRAEHFAAVSQANREAAATLTVGDESLLQEIRREPATTTVEGESKEPIGK
ncbi:MAG: carbon storage regulator [Firmicutes bacterium]|jgi:carbon storage regulator|nr:carbon storage regulator [Bacillota bacterium]